MNTISNHWGASVGAAFIHALVMLIPFLIVFYYFIPLQTYTHWAFVTYWRLIWIAPLTGVIHLLLRRETWRQRWIMIGAFALVDSLIVLVLAFSWGTYTG